MFGIPPIKRSSWTEHTYGNSPVVVCEALSRCSSEACSIWIGGMQRVMTNAGNIDISYLMGDVGQVNMGGVSVWQQ